MLLAYTFGDSNDDEDDLFCKPFSNFRVDAYREPQHNTMLYHMDDLMQITDVAKLFRAQGTSNVQHSKMCWPRHVNWRTRSASLVLHNYGFKYFKIYIYL